MHVAPAEVASELAPNGRLRAAINLGNPVLAQQAPDGALTGVTVDLATLLAHELGVTLELLAYKSGGAVVRGLGEDEWDVAFVANEPERAQKLRFAAPYILIEATYMVGADGPADVADVDRAGTSIAVGNGAAYHLILGRLLKHAELVLAETSAAAIDMFAAGGAAAVAGVRQTLLAAQSAIPGARVMDGHFSTIEQALAIPGDGSDAALAAIDAFCAERKKDGSIAEALAKSGQQGVRII